MKEHFTLPRTNIIGSSLFGFVFLGALLVITFHTPNPTPFQYEVFRITLALAASGIAAMIPGLLQVQLKNGIRATGAIAVFLIVYFFSPARLDKNEKKPGPKQTVHVAVLLNGKANYCQDARSSLGDTLQTIVDDNERDLHIEEEVGSPSDDGFVENKAAIERLLARFGGQLPDYFVTIGTAVSQHAKLVLAGKQIPQIFVAVTDPISAGLVSSLQGAPLRGNIAGTTYPPRPYVLLEKLQRYFPGQRLGFIYSRRFPQDIALKEKLEVLSRNRKVEIVFIETDRVFLTEDQIRSADIFFGKFMLCSNLEGFTKTYPHLKFIGASSANAKKGALAAIGPEDSDIGRLAALEIIMPNLLRGESLAGMNIIEPDVQVTVNVKTARRLGADVRTLVSDPNVKQVQ